MRGILQITHILIVMTIVVDATNFALSACSLSCNEEVNQSHVIPEDGAQGRPGKRGPVGQKGDRGVAGIAGNRGTPGESCICPDHKALATRVAALETQISILKGQGRRAPTGWTRSSNELFYKYFHETVNYETTKYRCAGFGGRLAAAGMRTAELRREIRRLLPNPFSRDMRIWIGLDDLVSQGNYVWSDGVKSTEANTDWGPVEPNRSSERCGALYAGVSCQVIDTLCHLSSSYICEL